MRLNAVMKSPLVVVALLLMLVQGAYASAMMTLVPNAELVGEARLKVVFFKIYDAQLFAPQGRYSPYDPYCLRLTYLIDAKKNRIISQTVKEMRRMEVASAEQIDRWIPKMEAAFISMAKGSQADFIHTPDGRLTLVANNVVISVIDDTALAKAIMDIWLGPKVRSRDFQNSLMGRK